MRLLTQSDLPEIGELLRAGELFWLDLDDPDPTTLDEVGRTLGLHELALEDTREFDQRPKLDVYEDQLLLVYFGAAAEGADAPVPIEVHIHVAAGYVLSCAITTATWAIICGVRWMRSTPPGTPSRDCWRPTATRSRSG